MTIINSLINKQLYTLYFDNVFFLDIPMQTSIRISYFSIFITVSIVYATYSGCLTSFFTAPTIIMPFNDMVEFSKQKEYELIMLKESADYDVFYVSILKK